MTDIASALAEPQREVVPPIPIAKRHLLSAVLGNAFEFYDFTVFAYFAAQIGQTFFPSHSAIGSLLPTLATFWVGFLSRPVGESSSESLADRAGRTPAMVLSFALMGVGILALALTPSYAAIGVAAPILVILARLVQGFALGGQVGPSTAFLLEAASPKTRGFYTTFQYSSQGLATLCGGFVGVVLSSVLDASSLQQWGWRVAMILGALILPFGLMIRRNMPETLERRAESEIAAARAAPRPAGRMRVIVLGLLMLASATICTYVLNYMTTYATVFLHMRANVSFGATMVFGACNIVFSLVGGAMSDRYGRKPVMIWPRVLLLFAIYPAFALLAQNRDGITLLGVTAIIATSEHVECCGKPREYRRGHAERHAFRGARHGVCRGDFRIRRLDAICGDSADRPERQRPCACVVPHGGDLGRTDRDDRRERDCAGNLGKALTPSLGANWSASRDRNCSRATAESPCRLSRARFRAHPCSRTSRHFVGRIGLSQIPADRAGFLVDAPPQFARAFARLEIEIVIANDAG